MNARDRATELDREYKGHHQQWIRVRAKVRGLGCGAWLYCRIYSTLLQIPQIKETLGYRAVQWEHVADPDPATLKPLPLINDLAVKFYMEAHL